MRTKIISASVIFTLCNTCLLLAEDPNLLDLKLPTTSVSEDLTTGITATVSRAGSTAGRLTVKIECSDPNTLYVPSTTTIPTGEASAEFKISVNNNGAIDGSRQVTVTVSADGFTEDSEAITVNDDDTPARLTLGGHLHGRLSSDVYWVLSQISVDNGKMLEIEPDVTLLFGPNTGLSVSGQLKATGQEGKEITFTSDQLQAKPGDWSGLSIYGSCNLERVTIAYANTGLSIGTTAATISHSTIFNCRYDGISVSAYASGCTSDSARGTILDNEIFANGDDGISLRATGSSTYGCIPISSHASVGGLVSGNYIHHNAYGVYAYCSDGYHTSGYVYTTIRNNIITNNDKGGVYVSGDDPGTPILNNTIVANGGAGIRHGSSIGSALAISNNIITRNNAGLQTAAAFTPPSNWQAAYNDVFDNNDLNWINYPATYGVLTTTNTLGTPADMAMNISIDPGFVELGHWNLNGTPDDPNDDVWIEPDFHLKSEMGRWDSVSQDWVHDAATSPCVDAGDPGSDLWKEEPWPNGQIVNLGAYGGTSEASMSLNLIGEPNSVGP